MKRTPKHRRSRRLQFESLEARRVLATLQLTSIPAANYSGWATVYSEVNESIEGDEQIIEYRGDGLTSVPSFSYKTIGSGSYSLRGPLTFTIVPSDASEVGQDADVEIDWDYFASWDLDPLHPGGVFGKNQGGENLVYAAASTQPIGQLFDWAAGVEPAPVQGLWSSADTSGLPEEEDGRIVRLEVGKSYAINVDVGGESKGLWAGGSDFHGGTYTSVTLSVALRTDKPDLAVEMQSREGGGAVVTYELNNFPDESEVRLFWAKKGANDLLTPLGEAIHSIATPSGRFHSRKVTDVSLSDLPQPPREATHLLAFADPDGVIDETSEDNNYASMPLNGNIGLDARFFKHDPEAPNGVNEVSAVHKGDSYQLAADATNAYSVNPVQVDFDYAEFLAHGEPQNLFTPTQTKEGIKETILLPSQTRTVEVDTIRKTWDWIPPDPTFVQLNDVESEALEMLAAAEGPLLGGAGVFSFIDGVIDAVNLLYPLAEMEPWISLDYSLTVNSDGLAAGHDNEQLRIDVPDSLQSKLALWFLTSVNSEFTKGAAWAAAFSGAGLPLAALLRTISWASEEAAEAAYLQAFDPPDNDYKNYATVAFSDLPQQILDVGGSPLAWAHDLNRRQALEAAEGASRDKSFGARNANDPAWQSNQLVAASGFAAAGMELDMRRAIADAFTRPIRAGYKAQEADLQTEFADDVPQGIKDQLLELDFTLAEIEEFRQAFLNEGFRDDPGQRLLYRAIRAQTITSVASSIDELSQAVSIRRDMLGHPIKTASAETLNRLFELKIAIESEENKFSLRHLNNLQQMTFTAREAILQTNDFPRYEDDLYFAYDRLLEFQTQDFTLTPLFDRLNETFASGQTLAALRQFLDDAQAALVLADYDDAKTQLQEFSGLVSLERGEDINTDQADLLLEHAKLLLDVLCGGAIGPAFVRLPQTVSGHVGDAPAVLSLDAIAHDRDSQTPLAWSIVGVEHGESFGALLDNNELTISFLAANEPFLQPSVTLRATDGDGKPVDLAILVNVFTSDKDLQPEEIPNQFVDEGALLDLDVPFAQDLADGRKDFFNYRVATDLPGGAQIDEYGRFLWFPTEELGGQTFDVQLEVDRKAFVPETFVREFQITVNEREDAPALSPFDPFRILADQPFSFTAEAVDYDLPAQTITYALINAPGGAAIHPNTGVFNWTPDQPGVFNFQVEARDSTDRTHAQPVSVEVFDGAIPPLNVDLTPSHTVLHSETTSWGELASVSARVDNLGSDRSSQFHVGWRLSPNPDGTGDATDLLLVDGSTSAAVNNIPGNGTSTTITSKIRLPNAIPSGWAGDTFWILPVVDPENAVGETDETNNTGGGVRFVDADTLMIADTRPDLAPAYVVAPAAPVAWESTFVAAADIANLGQLSAETFQVRWYLSADSVASPDDIVLKSPQGAMDFAVEPLGPGERSGRVEWELLLPEHGVLSGDGGSIFLIARIDSLGEIDESNEGNNFGELGEYIGSARFDILAPDLVAQVSSSPTPMAWGEAFDATGVVNNIGNTASNPSNVGFYLLDDPEDMASAVRLADGDDQTSFPIGALDAQFGDKDSESVDSTLRLPESQPAGWNDGEYWLAAVADADETVDESFEANNVNNLIRLLAYEASDTRPDLSPYTVITPFESFHWGDTVELEIGVANKGASAAPESKFSLYLSADEELSGDDLPLTDAGETQFEYPALAAGEFGSGVSVNVTLPEYRPLNWESVFVLAVADSDDEIDERLEGDNVLSDSSLVINRFRPDLVGVISKIDVAPQSNGQADSVPTSIWGQSIPVTGYVTNAGPNASESFQLKWFLSSDSTWSADDPILPLVGGGEAYDVAGLDGKSGNSPQHDYDVELQLPATAPIGLTGPTFFLILKADSESDVDEFDEVNNVASSRFFVTPPPVADLRGGHFYISQTESSWGSSLDLQFQIQNAGNLGVSEPFDVQFVISPDESLSGDDILLQLDDSSDSYPVNQGVGGREWFGSLPFSRLAITTTQFATVQLPSKPAGWDADSFWVLMVTDSGNVINETNEGNNSGQRGKFVDRDQFSLLSFSWHNAAMPFDVTGDGRVALDDPFRVIQAVREGPLGPLPDPGPNDVPPHVDVDNDMRLTLIDAFATIDEIRRIFSGSGEGEFSQSTEFAPAAVPMLSSINRNTAVRRQPNTHSTYFESVAKTALRRERWGWTNRADDFENHYQYWRDSESQSTTWIDQFFHEFALSDESWFDELP